MCGIVGILGDISADNAVLQIMADRLVHRGPDDSGCWVDVDHRIGLAHRRLSVLDPSSAGHQPMTCPAGRYVIAFNGEIYNHLDLRAEMEKMGAADNAFGVWRGHSDTETLLVGFGAWGIKATVERCVGMFAFAVWDKKERVLVLARDRLGEKPLYFGWQGKGTNSCFLFGSELKALKMHPAFAAEINRDALCLLMRHNYIPAPHSIYRGIHKLQPGSLVTVSLDNREPCIEYYWSLTKVAIAGSRSPIVDSPESMIDELELMLKSAVRKQMMADVPIGAFLSGGVDSSTVVALMQAQSERRVKTFTIGFHENGYDEAVYAKAIAQHLGTDHTELYLSAQQSLDVIPKLPRLYCEPFADSSQIPTFLVSKLAREQVTVCLSGDAGDELFGGYNRYVITGALWHVLVKLPVPLRQLLSFCLRSVSPSRWNMLGALIQEIMPNRWRANHFGEKMHKAGGVLAAKTVEDLYLGLTSHWQPHDLVLGGVEPPSTITMQSPILDGLDNVQRMMVMDAISYLPDDILTKVDRATMGVGLETRTPFLDHRVVELAWNLPQGLKIRDGVGKWALRQVLYRHVPRKLIDRPKMGFGVPIDSWLRGPLRGWAEDLLGESRLRKEGFFNPAPIRKKWAEHVSGARNWQHHLWALLMFQSWLQDQGPSAVKDVK